MGLLILTPERIARLKRGVASEELGLKQSAYVDERTRAAELGEQRPEMLPMDCDLETLATSLSWDFSPGWEQRRMKFVRGLRAARKRFMPAARRPIPGGGFENIYPYGDLDLQWFAEGFCCVRCQNWKHEDSIQHVREHERLREQMTGGVQPPSGVPLKDLCAFCGNNLANQKTMTEAA